MPSTNGSRTRSAIPAADRKLVTGHESMGYFADRYGFTLVGALVPSISSQAEASAADLAELTEQIEAVGVSVIFIEIGTQSSVADAIGDETGATVVELPSQPARRRLLLHVHAGDRRRGGGSAGSVRGLI